MIPRRNVPVVMTSDAAAQPPPVGEVETARPCPVAMSNVVRLGLDDGEARCVGDQPLHRRPVELAVGLGARSLNSGPLAAVEDAELDAGGVGGAAHQPVERVDLAHEVALAEPADRRVAGHLADVSKRWVTRAVRAPQRAAAAAASDPACPPPITMTSKVVHSA